MDFDGTVVEHKYPEIGHDIGAVPWLKRWLEAGARIILWTMRDGKELGDAVNWFIRNGVELWGINENPEQHTWTQSRKAYAELYVDDLSFGCPLVWNGERAYVDWAIVGPAVLQLIKQKK